MTMTADTTGETEQCRPTANTSLTSRLNVISLTWGIVLGSPTSMAGTMNVSNMTCGTFGGNPKKITTIQV